MRDIDGIVVGIVSEDDVIWTDGVSAGQAVDTLDLEPTLATNNQFIAKCPFCGSKFPDYFIPWSKDSDEDDLEIFADLIQLARDKPEAESSGALIRCSLEETLGYLKFLKGRTRLNSWASWVAIQQLHFEYIHLIRSGHLQAGPMETVASKEIRLGLEALVQPDEGFLAVNRETPNASSSEKVVDWATVCDALRSVGQFESAARALELAHADFEAESNSGRFSNNDMHAWGAELNSIRMAQWAARLRLLGQLLISRSRDLGTIIEANAGLEAPSQRSSKEIKPQERVLRVFTFYINDPDSETGVFGQVAESQEEAEEELEKRGVRDYFLFEARDLLPEELPESANFRIKLSPHLGPQWLPIVDALEIVITDPRSQFMQLQTLAREYGFDPNESPYIQGTVLADGRYHLEAPKHFFESSVLDQNKMQQMLFVGWNPPGDDDATYNYWRVFDFGWNPRSIAEFTLETLTSVFGVTDQDFFNFGSTWQPEELASKETLHRVKIDEDNPEGVIFRLPDGVEFPVTMVSKGESQLQSPEPQPQKKEKATEKHRRGYSNLISMIDEWGLLEIRERARLVVAAHDSGDHAYSQRLALELVEKLKSFDPRNFSIEYSSRFTSLIDKLESDSAKFPRSFMFDEAVRYSELPPGLQKLIKEMVERVQLKYEDFADKKLVEYLDDSIALKHSEVQREMNTLLRMLVTD